MRCSRRVATPETYARFSRRYATKPPTGPVPALKGRAKFIPTLRAEDTEPEFPSVCDPAPKPQTKVCATYEQ
jgi:hypothetical protein